MGNNGTSGKRKESLRKPSLSRLKRFDSNDEIFRDTQLVKSVLIDALMDDDIETFKDALIAHIKAVPLSALSEKTKLGRRTLSKLLDENKEFNPTLSTLTSILKAISA